MLHCSSCTLYFQLPSWLSKEWGSYHEAYDMLVAKINDEFISNSQRFSASLFYAKVQPTKLLAVLSAYCTLVTLYMLTFFYSGPVLHLPHLLLHHLKGEATSIGQCYCLD